MAFHLGRDKRSAATDNRPLNLRQPEKRKIRRMWTQSEKIILPARFPAFAAGMLVRFFQRMERAKETLAKERRFFYKS